MRSLRRRHRYLIAIARDLSELAALPGERPAQVDFRFATDDADLRAIDHAAARDGYKHRFRTMKATLRAGGRIAVAEHDRTPVAWLMQHRGGQDTYMWLRLRADEDSVFGFGLYTVRPWRRLGLASALMRYSAMAFLAEGCRFECGVVESDAPLAVNFHRYVERREVGFIRRLRLKGDLAFVRTDQGARLGEFNAANPFLYRFPRASTRRSDGL
jgi:GNAT superfamily N-acetyltransferase